MEHTLSKSEMNPKVDAFLAKAKKWREEMKKLRAIILGCPFTEDLKWGKPCYAFQGHNVVLIIPFKETCALLFCQGALLKDPKGLLIKAGENTQAARQMRFTSLREIVEKEAVVKAYFEEAIAAEKAGLKVTYKKEFNIPEELQKKLDERPALKAAFRALTPGRRRAYTIFISAAKQSGTREARVEKWIPQILKGKGMNDE